MITSIISFLRREPGGAIKSGVTTNLQQCMADLRRSHGALTFRSARLGMDAAQPALLDRREWPAAVRGRPDRVSRPPGVVKNAVSAGSPH
jgi:hypothetical protein